MAIRSYDTVNLAHARSGYSRILTRPFYLIILSLSCIPFLALRFIESASQITAFLHCDSGILLLLTTICTFAVLFPYLNLQPGPTYLVDFSCFRPRSERKVTKAEFIELSRKSGGFDEDSIEYMNQVLESSGIGDETSMPEQVFIPGRTISLNDGREEAAMVMFGAVDDLLKVTKIHPRRIGILIVNCGMLNTTPSLSAMLINHYKLREDVMSFNLGGMGCSAGVIAIDLASDLLASSPASYALVVSLEAVTHTWYKGKDRRMLLPNCFFRMGSAAMLLSNRRADGWLRAKYELQRVVRTHTGGDERSFESVHVIEDGEGKTGICVGADAMAVGARAVKENVALLENWGAFEHVCVHAASKAALECIQSRLNLPAAQMEASMATLRRFGNTSSSSIWYELAYLEAEGKVRNGHRVWQISFGSGFKCNSAVWKALRNIPRPNLSPWLDQ